MRKPRIFWIVASMVTLLAVVAVACGEEKKEEATPVAETPAVESPEASPTVETAEVPGVTDTEVILGTHQPLTGVGASYSQIAKVTKAYFDYINETEGGVHGRKITLLIEDDQYSPPLTVEAVRRLVEQQNVFAILNGLGTATHLQVVDYLLERGVPDMYMSTGATEWVKDPAARPNIFGAIPNYVGEGMVMGMYIAENFAGKKLGFIGQNDDVGVDGFDGVQRGVGDALEVLPMETYEPTDPDANSQVDRLRAAGADVLVVFALPIQAPAVIRHARADLGWDVPIFISEIAATEFTFAVAGAENVEDVFSLGPIKQAWQRDDPAVQQHIEIIKQYAGIDSPNFLTLYGQYVGEIMVATLELAGRDLTRQGLIEAAESLTDFTCSICLFPAHMSKTDHDPAQRVVMVRAELAPDEPLGARWVPFGDAYDWEGILPGDMTVDDVTRLPFP